MLEKKIACGILVGKTERKRPLGRSRRRWMDNIKTYLREIEWDGMDWMDLDQDRAAITSGNQRNAPEGPI
jgi:hypothetical protein